LALRASGSINSSSGMSFALAISCSVRWRIKIGLPRHITVIAWPGSMGAISTSVVASESVEASGFIWSSSGQSAAAAPTAAKPPAAIISTSRRVGSSGESLGVSKGVSCVANAPGFLS
jgi:hypothetical protein